MPNSLAVVGSQMDLAHQRFPERAAAAGLVVAVLNLMKGLRGRNGCPSPQKLKLESGELAQLEAAASAPASPDLRCCRPSFWGWRAHPHAPLPEGLGTKPHASFLRGSDPHSSPPGPSRPPSVAPSSGLPRLSAPLGPLPLVTSLPPWCLLCSSVSLAASPSPLPA